MRLGKHLLLGLLLSVMALGLYYTLTQHVIGDNALTRFDRRVADALHTEALESATARQFFRVLTELGNFEVLTALTVAVALVLVWWHHRTLALIWLIAQAGGGLLNQLLKDIVHRDRPRFEGQHTQLTSAPGLSFPSGHSMASLIAYGMLAYLLMLSVPVRWLRWLLVGLLAMLVLAIGFSRMFLGAHYFSDVIGGYCAATVWLTFCITAVESVRRRRLRMREAAAKAPQ
jgi:undecaprenyl-diphosphatase